MKKCHYCGSENPEDAVCCKNCGSLFGGAKPPAPPEKKNSTVPKSGKVLIIVLSVVLVAVIAVILFLVLSGRPYRNPAAGVAASETESESPSVPETFSETSTEPPTGIAYDTDEGLIRTRIPKTENLSDTEKLIAEYFDRDYFSFRSGSNAISDILAHPDVFQGVRICTSFRVLKIMESDGSSYKILGDLSPKVASDSGYNAVISGTFRGKHLVESDFIQFVGIFNGMKSYTIDGTSYYVPDISVEKYVVYNISYDYTNVSCDDRFSQADITAIAKTIFGENINIRKLSQEEREMFEDRGMSADPYYVVNFMNRDHLYFQEYWLASYGNILYDATTPDGMARSLYFMPDFRHYLIAEQDSTLSTFTLHYYDAELNKVWNREFHEIDSVAMDYTSRHIYLVAGQKLYILSMEDGSDQIEPILVGKRDVVYKMADSLLLLGAEGADGLVKTDLSGNILWSVTLSGAPDEMQAVNGNYVINGSRENENDLPYFIEVVTADGQVINTVKYVD